MLGHAPVSALPVSTIVVAVASFDASLMAAMSRPWRDIVFSPQQVVASGMTPPDSVPT